MGERIARPAVVTELVRAIATDVGSAARVGVRRAELSTALRVGAAVEQSQLGRPAVIVVETDERLVVSWLWHGLAAVFGYPGRPVVQQVGEVWTLRVMQGAMTLAAQAGLLDRSGRLTRGLPPSVVTGTREVLAGVWRGGFLAAGTITGSHQRVDVLRVRCPTVEVALALVGAARRLDVRATTETSVSREDEVIVRGTEEIARLLEQIGAPTAGAQLRRERADARRPASMVGTPANFDTANRDRALIAAAEMATRVQRALSTLGGHAPVHLAEAGRLRVEHPELSLEELGKLAEPPLTKDAIAGRIRRLINLGERLTN